jgi:predicted nucleic acid-binding protein
VILVDTNVLTEFMRPEPAQDVVAWVAEQTEMAVSAVTVGELWRGALALPDGRRRETLLAQIEIGLRDHVGRILAYTGATARVYAHLDVRRRSMGKPLAVEDGMIAATAVIHSASLATRNVADFADLGLEVIDPWNL